LDGGQQEPAPADAGPPVSCVVGQSYCSVYSTKLVGALPSRGCTSLSPDGGLGVCADNPTCSCICAQMAGEFCNGLQCACDDSGGFVTISCQQA
jgi:hypothetical protein